MSSMANLGLMTAFAGGVVSSLSPCVLSVVPAYLSYVAGRGIFRSDNGGGAWKLMDNGPRERIEQFVHSNMPGSMQTGWLFAATATGVGRSMDCFCGWRDAGVLAREVRAIAYDPREPQRVYAVAKDGLLVSVLTAASSGSR